MSSTAEFGAQDGHTMLLMELRPGQRTFKFYNTQHECLIGLVGMFEETSERQQMSDFLEWIDDFYQLRMFVLDTNIKRYKIRKGEELKSLFEESDESKGTYRPTENGHDQIGSSLDSSSLDMDDHREQDMVESDDDETHWDD